MFIGIIIFIIIVTLLVIAAYSLRLFSIERVDTVLPDSPVDGIADEEGSEESEESGEEGENPEGEEPTEEMVDLFEHFSEDDEDDEAKKEQVEEGDGNDINNIGPDKLTDFKTGRKYLVDCKKTLESARDDGHIYCAMYFDFDRFSYINSLKGAATGDYVLTNTAQQLRRIFPEGTLFTRISCDHFAAVFPLVDLALFDEYYEHLKRMADKIKNDIAAKTGIKISVGFATTDNDISYDINVLLARANVARYSAKVTKAERFETYDESMISSNFYGDTLMEDYSECQYADDFAIYFETQIDLIADKIVGCDTLVRWNYEDKATNAITQDKGRIPTNNDKVIYQVCRAMSRWRKAAREIVQVFVDVPVIDLFKNDIDEFIGRCLVEFQIDPQTLCVKVDACCVRLDWSMCSKQFKKFHDLGIKICIYNMDTGYTNFEFLSGLTIDYVKLHRSYAHNVEKNPEQLDKCRKIIERASSIGARVIFEGVDTMDQVASFRTINVKTVQGRYSGKPYTADELIRALPEHVERRQTTSQTVILDESQLSKGDWTI